MMSAHEESSALGAGRAPPRSGRDLSRATRPDLNFDDAARSLPTSPQSASATLRIADPRGGATAPTATTSSTTTGCLTELGGEEGFSRLAAALQRAGLGLILDSCPNHMGITRDTTPGGSTCSRTDPGRAPRDHFDIDWHPVKTELDGEVLLPILGDVYGAALDSGQLQLMLDAGRIASATTSTVAPADRAALLRSRAPPPARGSNCTNSWAPSIPSSSSSKSVITWFASIPASATARATPTPAWPRDRGRGSGAVSACARCSTDRPTVRAFLEENLRLFKGTPGDPRASTSSTSS